MIYLDYAATSPVSKEVADAVCQTLTQDFSNPSAQYAPGLRVKQRLEDWRGIISNALDCDPERLIFTSCGTESDNWAISAACWQNRHIGRHVITTAVEHNAILKYCEKIKNNNWRVTYIQPDKNGDIYTQDILNAITPETALISVMLVNNETGNRYPVETIAREVSKINPDILLHTDAVQGFLKIPFSARTSGLDFISISAHKIGGPKGIGALYISPRVKNPRPFIFGGGQERGLRSGTEATSQIAGFAKAVEIYQDFLKSPKYQDFLNLRAYAVQALQSVPDCVMIGGGNNPAPHILSAALTGWPSQNIINDLSAQNIYISAGSACHRGKISHVTAALKLSKKTAQSAFRLSFGPDTTKADIDACVQALRRHHDTRFPML